MISIYDWINLIPCSWKRNKKNRKVQAHQYILDCSESCLLQSFSVLGDHGKLQLDLTKKDNLIDSTIDSINGKRFNSEAKCEHRIWRCFETFAAAGTEVLTYLSKPTGKQSNHHFFFFPLGVIFCCLCFQDMHAYIWTCKIM